MLFEIVMALVCQIDASIIDIANDARIANAQRASSGAVHFESSLQLKNRKAIKIEGDFAWHLEKGLWIYSITDPESNLFRNHDNTDSKTPTKEYLLFVNNTIYTTDTRSNILHIKLAPYGIERSASVYPFIDLFPNTLWLKCCPPEHTSGTTWLELTKRANQSDHRPGKISASADNNFYEFIRDDPGKGSLSTKLSLELAGNVISSKYTSSLPRISSKTVSYQWSKHKSGVVVLDKAISTTFDPGDSKTWKEVFTSKLTNTTIGLPDDSRFSPENFYKLLPKNMLVVDNIKKKQYRLGGSSSTTDLQLKTVSDIMLKRGFAIREAP